MTDKFNILALKHLPHVKRSVNESRSGSSVVDLALCFSRFC